MNMYDDRRLKWSIFSLMMLFLFLAQGLMGQIRILPLGNSITLGKSAGQAPQPPEYGYRDHLLEFLEGYAIELVGPEGTAPYNGHFYDGAYTREFLQDSVYNIIPTLTTFTPNIVLLHIGTNNVLDGQRIGAEGQDDTAIDELARLMDILLNAAYNIDHIYLCKIIPRVPTDEFPGSNARIVDYNSKIQQYWNSLSAPDQDRVTIVDMYSRFFDNQDLYYTAAADDVHPNPVGYVEMGRYFADHIKDDQAETLLDHFSHVGIVGPDSLLNGINAWTATDSIRFHKAPNEDPAGVIYSDAVDNDWLNMAIWDSTRGMNSFSLRFHENSTFNTDLLSGVGMLVGMDTTIVDTASASVAGGYLVFVRNRSVDIYTLIQGQIATLAGEVSPRVASTGDIPGSWNRDYAPSDVFTVTYIVDGFDNIFYISLGGSEVRLVHTTAQNFGKKDQAYAGIVFRGNTGDPNTGEAALIDYFQARSLRRDVTAPGRISDLSVSTITNSTITLTWTAVGDDAYEPDRRASNYDLRYSLSPIGEDNFVDATIVPNLPVPSDQGTQEAITVKGLLSGVTYYFAVIATDRWGNSSEISNVVSGQTATIGEVVDNFDRATLGDDWVYDELEYGINQINNEVQNLQNSADWGGVALFKGISNPTTVKMRWGRNVVNVGGPDIANGGLVVLADDTTLTADGYLIFIRPTRGLIFLFEFAWITGVRVLTELDRTEYDFRGIGSYPEASDSVAVVVDVSDENFNKFDVYVNLGGGWRPASRFSLFDTRDVQFRHGLVEGRKYYAGFLLTQLQGLRNNNVDAFKVTGELASVASIEAVHPLGMAYGTVAQQLPPADSIRVLVRDDNGNALPNVPVIFRATSGAGELSVDEPADTHIRIEAEWGILQPLVDIYDDAFASRRRYITSPTVRSGSASYQFYVERPGTYYFWGRWRHVDRQRFRFAVGVQLFEGDNQLADFTWHVIQTQGSSDIWEWYLVHQWDAVEPWSIFLNQGVYTFKLVTAHAEMHLDKLLISNELSYVAGVSDPLEPDPAVVTNLSGQAAVAWTLGTRADDPTTAAVNEGLNTAIARALGTSGTVEFQATGISGAPETLVGNPYPEEAAAGDSVELSVTLYDAYANRYTLEDAEIDFEINSVDGYLSAAEDITDALGTARTYLHLGVSPSPYIVTARHLPSGSSVQFTVNVSSGFVDSIVSQTVERKFYVGDVLPNYLEVTLLDNEGSPLTNSPVFFSISSDDSYLTDAWVGRQPKITNGNGVARDTLWFGNTSGIVKVMAGSGPVQTTVIEDSVFYSGGYLEVLFGMNQVIDVGVTSLDSIRVAVRQAQNPAILVPNHPVAFISKGNGFTFPGGGESVVKFTDATGFAWTYVVAGPKHGQYRDIVEIRATDGFDHLQNSPYKVTLIARSAASRLEDVTVGPLEGIVGGTLSEALAVQMLDIGGDPVTGQPVTFIRTGGDGEIIGGGTEVTVLTDDVDGTARVLYKLGQTAGTDNIVEARATNGIPGNNLDPIVFQIQAMSSGAHAIAAASETNLTGAVVGKPQTVLVKVEDDAQNAVPGERVDFSILQGGGVLNGTADTTTSVVTNSFGIATVLWTVGTRAGRSNILEAKSTNGVDPLQGSPLRFTAVPIPDSVSSTESTIEAESPVYAVIDSVCHIVVTLRDRYGNVIPGKELELTVTGGLINTLKEKRITTDINGRAYGELQSTTKGEKTIRVIVDGDTLGVSATAVFLAASAARIEYVHGNNQTGNIGTIVRDSLVVKVTDINLNPVAFAPVEFSIVGDRGWLVENGEEKTRVQAWSNESGYVWTYLRLDTLPGVNVVMAQSATLSGNAVFQAQGEMGQPATMFAFSGGDQVGMAGEVLRDPLAAMVIDQDGDPVFGVNVWFEVEEGNGSVVSSLPVKSDGYGLAKAFYRTDTAVGDFELVKAFGDQIGPVFFTVFRTAGPARKLEYVEGDGQSAKIGAIVRDDLVVKTTDRYGNPVAGQQVMFIVVQGLASFQGASTVRSDDRGEASVRVVMGNIAGPVVIEARTKLLEGSPVVFNLEADPSIAANIIEYAGNDQTGTLGQFMVDSLAVLVIDSEGNPVAGTPVYFYRDAGEGGIEGSGGALVNNRNVSSNAHGIAAVRYCCGDVEGAIVVKALIGTATGQRVVTFDNLRAAENPHSPIWLNKNNVGDTYTVQEGEQLIFTLLTEPDGDGDPLKFEIGNLTSPAGAEIVQSASAYSWIFRWTPAFNQSRAAPYEIVIRVVDGMGGFDGKTVRVYVLDTNRLPTIYATTPSSDTTLAAGQNVVFWVGAEDPDGDRVHYSWFVDNQPVLNDQAVFYHLIDKAFTGSRIVTVFVTDQSGFSDPNNGSFRWELTVSSSVELGAFAAAFEPEGMQVRIQWSTIREMDNLGFDVFRSRSMEDGYEKITEERIRSREDGAYDIVDRSIEIGKTYFYKLVSEDLHGNEREYGPLQVNIPVPRTFSLSQNYPNPFNPVTAIRFEVPGTEKVTLAVYNMRGQRIVTLVDEMKEPGYYTAEWDGTDANGHEVSTGIYLYQLTNGKQKLTKRMVKMQ